MGKTLKIELTLNQDDQKDHGDLAVEQARPKLKSPSMYKVIMFNDDYTPMEFVVEVLQIFFAMDREKATRAMMTVHTQGKAVCGVFTKDIAETKVAQVNQYANEHEHPLMCGIDRAD